MGLPNHGRGALRYRPYFDGLRAVAVYLVVAFHAGLGLASGGFVGVDVFFVLSGFLVTRILMRDLASTGVVAWRSFYARRVRRIIPAALVTLVVTAFAYAIIASPVEMFDALGGFRAAFFYVANWYFIHQATDYFAAPVNSSPVLQFWSLAVEEQFYLLWPLLLGALYLLTGRARRRWWVMRAVVVAAGVASAIAALHIASTNLARAYYGTDTRAYQLLAGAALALTPQLVDLGRRARAWARFVSAFALAALLLLATSALSMGPVLRGVLVTAITFTLMVALENDPGGLAKRTLSRAPLTYLGRISYGIYLWHWPVIIVATYGRHLAPLELFAITTPTATALAALSFHVIERPIRVSSVLDGFRVPVIAVGVTTSILLGVLVMPAVLDTNNTALAALATADRGKSGPKLLGWRKALRDYLPTKYHDCYKKSVDRCTVVKGSGAHIVLVGDSIARMWIPAFIQLARAESLTFSIASYPGCPWQEDLDYHGAVAVQTACAARQHDWYARVIPQLHPDIVFLAQHAYDDPHDPNRFNLPDGNEITVSSKDFESTLADMSAATIRILRRPGRRVVILEPVPATPASPLICLSLGKPIPECGFSANTAATPLERFFRKVAASDADVKSVDLDRVVCPRLPKCDAVVGDIIAWRDEGHVTATYARSLAPQLAATLAHKGILPLP